MSIVRNSTQKVKARYADLRPLAATTKNVSKDVKNQPAPIAAMFQKYKAAAKAFHADLGNFQSMQALDRLDQVQFSTCCML